MNEVIKAITERRSHRVYLSEQLKEEHLSAILKAGAFAPSGMNAQPWRFTVVQNKELLGKVNAACKKVMLASGIERLIASAKNPDSSAFYAAPALIIVSADKSAVTPVEDCAIALGYMFVAAESLGIGSCWINAVKGALESPEGKALKNELQIPESFKVYCSGAFGYKSAKPSAAPRKEGIVSILK